MSRPIYQIAEEIKKDDPFMGSGTTALACLLSNRNFIGYELDKVNFEIAERRIKEFDIKKFPGYNYETDVKLVGDINNGKIKNKKDVAHITNNVAFNSPNDKVNHKFF